MKTLINIICLMLIVSLSSCRHDGQSYKYHLDYISYENEDADDDEYGLLGPDGNSFPEKFKKESTPIVNGYFSAREEDGFTLCKINGDSYEAVANATGYSYSGVMCDGLIPVCKENENIQVIDGNGNVKFTLAQVDSVDVWNCHSYSCGKMRVQLNNAEYVFVDKEGHNAFNKSYKWATDFDNGYAVVGIGDDKYQLIKTDGESVLSFVCDDPDKIIVAARYRKLAAKDNKDIFTVYGFDGKFVYLPKMVEGIYALLENDFIFENDDNFGLMSYDDCRDKIYAKYERLVPNGKYFLGIPEDNDKVVKLLDANGTALGSLDGEEIISPIEFGYDFPNIIKRPDDRIFLVDEKGQMIGRAENFEFDIDDIKDAALVHNSYFPVQRIENQILSLCGDGKGIPNGEGAFFYKDSSNCHTYEINYFKNAANIRQFKGKKLDKHVIDEGVNYEISLSYEFDEPIVRETANSLNTSAWLQSIEVDVATTNLFYALKIYHSITSELEAKGCTLLFSNSNGCILRSSDSENLLVFKYFGFRQFTIRMLPFSESYVEYWKNTLEK